MKTPCTLKMNRKGEFTVFDESDTPTQCGKVGQRVYEYFVTIEATNKNLTDEGYVMENGITDQYFQETYNGKRVKCDSCELMAERAIRALRTRLYQHNKKVDLKRIYVRLHGTPFSFIEAEWLN